MKAMAPFAVSVLLLGLSLDTVVKAADPSPPPVCLNVRDIARTETPNDRTIVFHMRDGKIWRNTLRNVCPMLKISPYVQKLTGDLVCSNQQIIHVVQTGNDCALGDFSLGLTMLPVRRNGRLQAAACGKNVPRTGEKLRARDNHIVIPLLEWCR
jgi:hypothetical protein